MSSHYLVRCTAAAGRTMTGIYAARLTTTGIVATWKKDRAARYDRKAAADGIAARLARRFAGTVWIVEAVGVDA